MPPYPTCEMPHIREIRPHAHEIKFLLDPALAAEIAQLGARQARLRPPRRRPVRRRVPHDQPLFRHRPLDVFHRRGSLGRSKYRIRRYGDESSAFLERKMRQPAVLAKRRTRLSLSARSIICRVATPSMPSGPATGFIAASPRGGCGRCARCRMRAWRAASSSDGHPIRLTLDRELRARPSALSRVRREGDGMCRPLAEPTILELKYQGTSPALFKRLVGGVRARAADRLEVPDGAGGAGPSRRAVLSAPRRGDRRRRMPEFLRAGCRRRSPSVRVRASRRGGLLGAVVGLIYQRDAAGERDVVVSA